MPPKPCRVGIRPINPPRNPAGSLIILPECCEPLLPEGWLARAEASGVLLLRKFKHRPEMVQAALELRWLRFGGNRPGSGRRFSGPGFLPFRCRIVDAKIPLHEQYRRYGLANGRAGRGQSGRPRRYRECSKSASIGLRSAPRGPGIFLSGRDAADRFHTGGLDHLGRIAAQGIDLRIAPQPAYFRRSAPRHGPARTGYIGRA